MENPTDIQPEPSAGARPHVVVRGTAHLLASLPHLLGYHPGRSVVVMASAVGGSRPGGRTYRTSLLMTARFDLPAVDDVAAVVASLANPLAQAARARADRGQPGPLLLHVFAYEADDAVGAALECEVTRLADDHGHQVHDLVLVREGRYLPLVATGEPLDEHGAPGGGWQAVPEAADVPAVADLVLSGRFPADNRDEYVARVHRRDEKAAAATQLALQLLAMAPETLDPLDALGRLGRWVVSGQDEPAARDLARIVVTLDDRTLRDAVMARWLPRLFTLEDVLPAELAHDLRRAIGPWPADDGGALDRLLALAARVPAHASAPLLTVAGSVAWGHGEGTVANDAIDLALEVDPGYTMARLMREAVDKGLPPWARLRDVA